MNTGFFANERGVVSKAHLEHDGKVLCGYKPAASMQFQYCASGIHRPILECEKCWSAVLRSDAPVFGKIPVRGGKDGQ